MPLFEFDGKQPAIGKSTWIAPSAEIIGDVRIGKNCYIGFNAVIRGDFGPIIIGDETAVEEGVIIHAAEKMSIGNGVIIGHMVMIHDSTIEDCTLIGMQSILCDHSIIKKWSITGERSFIKKNQVIPSNKIYAGSPAKQIGELEIRHRDFLINGRKIYVDLAKRYIKSFKLINQTG